MKTESNNMEPALRINGRSIHLRSLINFTVSLLVFLIILLMTIPSFAQVAGKWRGFDDNNWNNSNNWDNGAVPNNTIDVVIPSG